MFGRFKPMKCCWSYAFICVSYLQVLLPAASLLQLMDVRQVCCEFLQSQLHPTNCLGIRAFADLHTCTQLLSQAHTFAGKLLGVHTADWESSLAMLVSPALKKKKKCVMITFRVFVSLRAAFHWGGAGRGVSGPLSAAGVQPHLQWQTHGFHRGEGQRTQCHMHTTVL